MPVLPPSLPAVVTPAPSSQSESPPLEVGASAPPLGPAAVAPPPTPIALAPPAAGAPVLPPNSLSVMPPSVYSRRLAGVEPQAVGRPGGAGGLGVHGGVAGAPAPARGEQAVGVQGQGVAGIDADPRGQGEGVGGGLGAGQAGVGGDGHVDRPPAPAGAGVLDPPDLDQGALGELPEVGAQGQGGDGPR